MSKDNDAAGYSDTSYHITPARLCDETFYMNTFHYVEEYHMG